MNSEGLGRYAARAHNSSTIVYGQPETIGSAESIQDDGSTSVPNESTFGAEADRPGYLATVTNATRFGLLRGSKPGNPVQVSHDSIAPKERMNVSECVG